MARRRRKHHAPVDAESPSSSPKPPPDKLQRPFAEALRQMKPARKKAAPKQAAATPARKGRDDAARGVVRRDAEPRPQRPDPAIDPAYAYEDRVAFAEAFSGVAPLGAKRRSERTRGQGVSTAARDSLREGTRASEAARASAEEAARARLDALVGGGVFFRVEREEGIVRGLRDGAHKGHVRGLGDTAAEATLDLHGQTARDASREVTRFVRDASRRGVRVVRIVHGRGKGSQGGVGVLQDATVKALTSGGAAPKVLAFVTASGRQGGEGALIVRLGER